MHHLRHGWLPVLVAWLATRVLLLGWVMGGAGYFDVGLYLKWSSVLAQGSFPVGEAEWQYPPAFGPMLLAFGSDPATFMQRFTLGMFVLDAVVLVALLLASRGRRGSTRGPWAWVVLGLCLGPTLYTHADLAPTALAVVSVLLAARPRLSGLFAGVGVLLKVWPGLALLAVPRRQLAQAAAVSLATALGLWALIALLIDDSGSFLAQQAGRGLQIEAAAAWPYLVWNVLAGGDAWAADAAYGSLMVGAESAGLAANVATVVGALAILALLWARIAGRLETVPGADVVLAATLVFVATNRVNSPQTGVWLAGVAAAALCCRRSRMLPVALLLAPMFLITDRLVLPVWFDLAAGDAGAVGAQTVRLALLVAAAVYAMVVVLRPATGAAHADFHVAAVVLRDAQGRVLVVRKRGTHRYMLPGGKIEIGETPAEAAVRELREEVGVDLDSSRLAPLGSWTAPAANEPEHLVHGEVFTHPWVPGVTASAEIDDVQWLHPDAMGDRRDLAPLLVTCVRPALLDSLRV